MTWCSFLTLGFFQLRLQAKEKISDAARQTSEEGFFNPLEQFTAQARRAAEEAGRSVKQEASRTLEDLTYASKNTIEDITKQAKQAATKGGLLKVTVYTFKS